MIESPTAKILWDFRLVTTINHPSNCPDIVLYDFCQQQIFFIEISCPADINVVTKEDEKINKYCSLAADFHQMYNMPVTIIPIVLGCMGVVSSHCLQFLKINPRVHNEIVRPLTQSCADWDFTSIKNNTHSLMNYFLCITAHVIVLILLYYCTCESLFMEIL